MNVLHFIARQLAYDDWANREVVTALRAPETPLPLVALLGHVVAAEALWLARVRGEPPPLAVWPDLDLAAIESHQATVARAWQAFVDGLEPARLAEPIAYTNSKGEKWVSALSDVLAHVVLHSAYHRGQIASGLRGAGLVPAYTDFIHCTRNGWI